MSSKLCDWPTDYKTLRCPPPCAKHNCLSADQQSTEPAFSITTAVQGKQGISASQLTSARPANFIISQYASAVGLDIGCQHLVDSVPVELPVSAGLLQEAGRWPGTWSPHHSMNKVLFFYHDATVVSYYRNSIDIYWLISICRSKSCHTVPRFLPPKSIRIT